MAGAFENQKTGVRILFGVIIGMLALSMLLYLIPQGPGAAQGSTDVVATVGDQSITVGDIRQRLSQIAQTNQVPKALEGLYAHQILNQLVFQKEIEHEAKRLGITVSNSELADRIRQYVPGAFNSGTFAGKDAYTQQVQQRFQMRVPEFEELIRQSLVEEKFRKLITDGVSVSPAEIAEAFRQQNEKVKLDYVLITPEGLAEKITPDNDEIKAYYEKNKSSFLIPEKRVVRYALVDLNLLRQTTTVTDDELKAAYQQNIQQFQVPNRVHAQHILLTTVGKTDAEVEEVKKKAEDILAQAKKKGSNFEELAKKYSEDPGSKTKGGDIGWIVQGQTVPEFEKTAFSLNKGDISDLVKTQYGFHIIKVLDKENAHTKVLDEVKDTIRPNLRLQKADKIASDLADKIAAEIRQSGKITLDEIAQKYHLNVAETRPVGPGDAVLELGNSKDAKDEILRQRQGEVSLPLRTDRGYVVLSLKQIQPAHAGTLDEVRDKVVAALKTEKADQLARTKATELESKLKAGQKFDAAAKSLGLEAKTSDLFARNGAVPSVGSGKQLAPAFSLKPGQSGAPLNLGSNWVVYQVREKTEANPADFDKQKKSITDTLLQEKRTLAFDSFRLALEERLKKDGTVKLTPDKLGTSNDFGLPKS
jgi:peptidyl-prolyl cis-trans isomerase D